MNSFKFVLAILLITSGAWTPATMGQAAGHSVNNNKIAIASSPQTQFDAANESPDIRVSKEHDEDKVRVPNVVGLTIRKAKHAIRKADLEIGSISQEHSTAIAAGLVMSQHPTAGTRVKEESRVRLVVSSGTSPVAVPNVIGSQQAAAISLISGAGLKVGTITTQPSATAAPGIVVSEAPAAGTRVALGASINLVVSSGPPKIVVPNVVGATQAAATAAIVSAGLKLGTVTSQVSTTMTAGLIISETPMAGSRVAPGSLVNLIISTAGPPVLSTIAVAPPTSLLLLSSRLQFNATGIYSDGRARDITNSVTWSSSVPSVATISSAGLLVGNTAGDARITATLGPIQGAATITIGSSRTGFIFNADVTDSSLFTYTNTDGSIAAFFGTRDAAGLPTAISSSIVTFPDQSSEKIELDAALRPTLITLSKGGQISLNWTSATQAILTSTSPDGTAEVTTVLDLSGPQSKLSNAQRARQLQGLSSAPATLNTRALTSSSAAGPSSVASQATVQVLTCGKPEEQGNVTFQRLGIFGSQSIPAIGFSGGIYVANMPSGPGDVARIAAAAHQSLTDFCKVYTEPTGVVPSISAFASLMCSGITVAVVAASDFLAAPAAAAINAGCVASVVGLTALDASCKANSAASVVSPFVDYFVANTPYELQATAQVQGLGTLVQSASNPGPLGPPPIPPIDFGCPSVSTVKVFPPALTVGEGSTAPVVAEISGSNGIIQSSGYIAAWSPSSGADATVLANPPSLSSTGASLGASTATVTGGNAPTPVGAPVTITAVSNHVSGSAQVTVVPRVELQLTPPSQTVGVLLTTTLTVSASNGSTPIPIPPNLVWTSSDNTIATVVDGLVTGQVVTVDSTATITVQDPVSKATASAQVIVTGSNTVLNLTISPNFASVLRGQTTTYTVAATLNGIPIPNSPLFTWDTDDARIATVTPFGGVVTGVSAGSTNIRVRNGDPSIPGIGEGFAQVVVTLAGQTFNFVSDPLAPSTDPNCNPCSLPGPVSASVTLAQPVPIGFSGVLVCGQNSSTPVTGNYISSVSVASAGVGQTTQFCFPPDGTESDNAPTVYFSAGEFSANIDVVVFYPFNSCTSGSEVTNFEIAVGGLNLNTFDRATKYDCSGRKVAEGMITGGTWK